MIAEKQPEHERFLEIPLKWLSHRSFLDQRGSGFSSQD